MENKSEQEMYTEAYLDFHKTWENNMNSCVTNLNNSKASEEVTAVIRAIEELDAKLRESSPSTYKRNSR
ncbi:hypothetical protein TNCV_3617501 [Trichonephila clavipes]|nr:hypothetical protein TNCV_3617501 [Trichonephila clavipes]